MLRTVFDMSKAEQDETAAVHLDELLAFHCEMTRLRAERDWR